MYHPPTPVHLASGHLVLPPAGGPRGGSRELFRSTAAARRHAIAEGLRSTVRSWS